MTSKNPENRPVWKVKVTEIVEIQLTSTGYPKENLLADMLARRLMDANIGNQITLESDDFKVTGIRKA